MFSTNSCIFPILRGKLLSGKWIFFRIADYEFSFKVIFTAHISILRQFSRSLH